MDERRNGQLLLLVRIRTRARVCVCVCVDNVPGVFNPADHKGFIPLTFLETPGQPELSPACVVSLGRTDTLKKKKMNKKYHTRNRVFGALL